jgi:hypothetical protein
MIVDSIDDILTVADDLRSETLDHAQHASVVALAWLDPAGASMRCPELA